jgi:hypothetical protein
MPSANEAVGLLREDTRVESGCVSHPPKLVHPECRFGRQTPHPFLGPVEEEVHIPGRRREPKDGRIGLAEGVSAIPVLRHAGIPGEARCLSHVLLLGAAERNPNEIHSNIGAGSPLQPLCLEFGDPEQTLPSRR